MTATHKPEDFFSDTPPERIIGTETECDLQVPPGYGVDFGQRFLSPTSFSKAGYGFYNEYLSNGMRAYYDARHVEISSAEARGPRQAAAAHSASLTALTNIIEASGLPHAGLYLHAGTAIKASSQSSGYHENYLIPRTLTHSGYLETILGSLLAARVYCLSGVVGQDGFRLSQKSHDLKYPTIQLGRTERRTAARNKPMAGVPPAVSDHDVMGNAEWARFEVRYAEPAYSNTSKYLGYAVTSLGLRIAEQGHRIDKKFMKTLMGASFGDQAEAAKYFGNDLTFRQAFRTVDGKNITALDYNRLFADVANSLRGKVELPQDELDGLDLLYEVCDQLSDADIPNGRYGKLLTMLDFAPRHKFLAERFNRLELHSGNDRAVTANLIWDRMLPEGGGKKFWDRVGSPYVTDKEVDDLVYNPPRTRAAARAKFINRHTGTIWKMNWSDGLTHYQHAGMFHDPWDTELRYKSGGK